MLDRAARRLLGVILLLACACVAQAHDPGLSTARATIGADSIDLEVAFAPADAVALLGPGARPAAWTPAGVDARRPELLELGALLYAVRADGAALAPSAVAVEVVAGDRLSFRLHYTLPAAEAVEFEALNLGALPSGHREYFVAHHENGREGAARMLNARQPRVVVPLVPVAAEDEARNFPGFFKLGVEHIWTGYDHLLFLFGMLLVCRTARSMAMIVTAFTVAHSLTLAAATLGWVTLSGAFVEPAIAASIVYVGVENLARKGAEPHGRCLLTFAFGLVHGFGFAGMLAELGVGADGRGVAVPLLAFNLGVELGQLAIAAVVLPLLALARRSPAVERWLTPVASAGIALAGAWWLVERVWMA